MKSLPNIRQEETAMGQNIGKKTIGVGDFRSEVENMVSVRVVINMFL